MSVDNNSNSEEQELPEPSVPDPKTEVPRKGNKYQWADCISNDEDVIDVHVIGDTLGIGYQMKRGLDLEWVRHFLAKKGYVYQNTVRTQGGLQKDIFQDQYDENEN